MIFPLEKLNLKSFRRDPSLLAFFWPRFRSLDFSGPSFLRWKGGGELMERARERVRKREREGEERRGGWGEKNLGGGGRGRGGALKSFAIPAVLSHPPPSPVNIMYIDTLTPAALSPMFILDPIITSRSRQNSINVCLSLSLSVCVCYLECVLNVHSIIVEISSLICPANDNVCSLHQSTHPVLIITQGQVSLLTLSFFQ